MTSNRIFHFDQFDFNFNDLNNINNYEDCLFKPTQIYEINLDNLPYIIQPSQQNTTQPNPDHLKLMENFSTLFANKIE